MTIRTNSHVYDLISFCDLTPKEAKDFDYIEEEEQYSPRLFRYRGNVYDANEFTSVYGLGAPSEFQKWSGYQSDSFFSGVLVRFVNDCEQVIVATYFA